MAAHFFVRFVEAVPYGALHLRNVSLAETLTLCGVCVCETVRVCVSFASLLRRRDLTEAEEKATGRANSVSERRNLTSMKSS